MNHDHRLPSGVEPSNSSPPRKRRVVSPLIAPSHPSHPSPKAVRTTIYAPFYDYQGHPVLSPAPPPPEEGPKSEYNSDYADGRWHEAERDAAAISLESFRQGSVPRVPSPEDRDRAPPEVSTPFAGHGATEAESSTSASALTNNKPWKTPTGHRRGITVKELLPLEAPTQPKKKCKTPLGSQSTAAPSSSSTTTIVLSRPRLPPSDFTPNERSSREESASNSRGTKRPRASSSAAESVSPAHSSALSLEFDQDNAEYGGGPTSAAPSGSQPKHPARSSYAPTHSRDHYASQPAGDQSDSALSLDPSTLNDDPISLKRRQNTIAARRSRQRKLEHVRSLERQVEDLTGERDELRTRVARLEDRVAFLKEIVAGGGNSGMTAHSAAMAMSPRVSSIGSLRPIGGSSRPRGHWTEERDELYDEDDVMRRDEDEYNDE